MESLEARLARLEERHEGLEEKVDERFKTVNDTLTRNHAEAQHWRNNMRMTLEQVVKDNSAFRSVLDQAKGARWLAGLILTGMGGLALVGVKAVGEWAIAHFH
jgi:hypothetical protein